jgi:ribosomal protein S10
MAAAAAWRLGPALSARAAAAAVRRGPPTARWFAVAAKPAAKPGAKGGKGAAPAKPAAAAPAAPPPPAVIDEGGTEEVPAAPFTGPLLDDDPRPVSAPPTQPGALVIQIRAAAYHVSYVNRFVTRLAARLESLGLPAARQVFLPRRTERWTVLRSPHVDKKARDQFERVTYKRLVEVRIDSAPGAGGVGPGAAATPAQRVEAAYRLVRGLSGLSAGVTVTTKYLSSGGPDVFR